MADLPARIRREFRWGAQRLDDPDPSMTPEEVRDLYSSTFPELTTAAVQKEEPEGGKAIVTFVQSSGVRAQPKTESYKFVGSQGTRG